MSKWGIFGVEVKWLVNILVLLSIWILHLFSNYLLSGPDTGGKHSSEGSELEVSKVLAPRKHPSWCEEAGNKQTSKQVSRTPDNECIEEN